MANTDALFAALKPVDGRDLLGAGPQQRRARSGARGGRQASFDFCLGQRDPQPQERQQVGERGARRHHADHRARAFRRASLCAPASSRRSAADSKAPFRSPGSSRSQRSTADIGAHEINIADSAGLANPKQVYESVEAVRGAIRPDAKISLHLHDTRGLGLANMFAGLQAGVTIYDAAVGGVGGCPFIPGATGNISTEDAVYALDSMGVKSGIDWRKLKPVTAELEEKLERRLPSRMAHMALPPGAAN